MNTESNSSPALLAILSILGILAIAIVAGMLLFQKQANPEQALDIGTALSSRDTVAASDDFDPISWARDGAAYPPLEEPESGEEGYVADYNGEGSIPGGDEDPSEPVVTKQPAAVSPPPAGTSPGEPEYREIRENAWWVQAFSSQNTSNAEKVRDELASAGFPANVIALQINGETWYRVRLGAFEAEGEAEHYADKVRSATSYESSYVVQAPVTRRVPVGD